MSFWSQVRTALGLASPKPEATKTLTHDVSQAGFGPFGSGAGGGSALSQFETNSAVLVPEHRVAEDASLVAWQLWKRRPDGTREQVYQHDVLDWWAQPQSGMLGCDWRYHWFVHLDLAGETFLWLLDPEDPALGTVILSPEWLESLPGTRGPNFNFSLPNGKCLELKPAECLHIKRPRPRNPLGNGLGFAAAMAEDLQQLKWMAKFNSQFFRNGAHIKNVLAFDNLDNEGWDRLEASYKANHQGVENAHKTFFASGKVTKADLGVPHKELDFNEGMRRTTQAVRQAIGVPATVSGDQQATGANAYEAGNVHQTYGIWPRCERMKHNVNTFLLPRFRNSAGLELDFENPIKQKAELLAMQMNQALDRGAISINEYRARSIGLGPVEGGDHALLPLNMLPVIAEQLGALQQRLLDRKGLGGQGGRDNVPTENPVDASGPQSPRST